MPLFIQGIKCKDRRRDCKWLVNHGQCTRHPRFMMRQCRKSCNRCPKLPLPPPAPPAPPPPPASQCEFEGMKYKVGESRADLSCKFSCKCKSNGQVSCVGLCPKQTINCRPPKVLITKEMPSRESGCTCKVRQCSKYCRAFIV